MKKIASVILILSLMLISFSGCVTDNGKEIQEIKYEEIYKPVIEKYYNLIVKAADSVYFDFEMEDGEIGVCEAAMSLGEDAMDLIGYTFRDLSGDNIPELIIGCSGDADYAYTKNEIYAVYTIENNAPLFVLEGRSRSFYSLMEDESFYYRGSNGAAYSIFGEYSLSDDGTELICKDYYFTYEVDEYFREFGYYHNTSGEWDKAQAEKLDISDEDFWKIEKNLAGKTVSIELTPFAETAPESEISVEEDGYITADFATDSEEEYYDEFVADDSDLQVSVAFSAVGNVKNFKLLGLSYEGTDDEGDISFREETLYETQKLPDGETLLVRMTFFGTIPSYGIAYQIDGAEKKYAVEMSGMDGSLLLTEF